MMATNSFLAMSRSTPAAHDAIGADSVGLLEFCGCEIVMDQIDLCKPHNSEGLERFEAGIRLDASTGCFFFEIAALESVPDHRGLAVAGRRPAWSRLALLAFLVFLTVRFVDDLLGRP